MVVATRCLSDLVWSRTQLALVGRHEVEAREPQDHAQGRVDLVRMEDEVDDVVRA